MDFDVMRERIRQRIAQLAGLEANEITAETTLEAVGLDSSDAVILALEVEELTGQEVDVGIFLRFSTLGEALEELVQMLKGPAPA
jgi:acyl carrier protein